MKIIITLIVERQVKSGRELSRVNHMKSLGQKGHEFYEKRAWKCIDALNPTRKILAKR
jgi:hypothetical protein